jgi:hypothetical protein
MVQTWQEDGTAMFMIHTPLYYKIYIYDRKKIHIQISYEIIIVYIMILYNDIFIDGDPIVNVDECTVNMTIHWCCFN